MQQQDTVFMRSPEGEIREVAATQEVLSPLMARGWHQATEAERVEFLRDKQEGK